ncbi:C2 domain-containing protein [Radiomyces spectabilis]|uniref:C2 domain-containing protein n=1 Tax=Radiomyces spectabilis TaxID=64574 RepID=UPI00221F79EF|nr:C2 domain-containing protein [Radiomyces spectabilis]KAI8376305.1 C2 domain-containing protein [Radiomyces spectabilis]
MEPSSPPPSQQPQLQEEAKAAQAVANEAIKTSAPDSNVYTFDAELSPAQKEAQAEKKANLGTIDKQAQENKAPPLATDLDTADTSDIAAAISSAGAKTVAPAPAKDQDTYDIPGTFTEGYRKGLPDWYKVGWTAFSALPNPGDEVMMTNLSQHLDADALAEIFKPSRTDSGEKTDDLISQFLSEAYYGEWYHNTAAMIFAVFFTWLLTRFGAGLMGCLVVGAFLATYYQTSIRRLRRNVRDDLQREMMTTKLETDTETAGWINHFLSRFWLIYEPVLSAQIIGIADAILIENTPSFLDSIRLSAFTLGTKAPIVESIKTYPKTEPNVVCMDWKVSFIPNDVLDLTHRDLQSKVNPKIVLTIRVGKGMIGAGMPVLLEDLAFSGTMRLRFKLFNEFPHVKTVQASFLEPPQFDYSLKPVGGETFGFDINNIPGLQTFVQEQVHATLGPMMYAPNVYTLDVAGMMAGTTDLDSANGVLAITVYSASNLKASDLFGTLDPYITFHIGNVHNTELGRTSAHEDQNNPKWDESHFVLLNNLNDSIYLQVMDRNSNRKDTPVGVATCDLKDLAEANNVLEGLNLVVLRNGKAVGEIKCDMRYFPVSRPDKQEDGTIIPPAESNSGILRFTVHECKQLGGEKKGGLSLPLVGSSDVNAYAIVRVNGQERLRTKAFKRSINPRWDKYVEVFVADKTMLDLGVNIVNSKEFSEDEVIGRWRSSLLDMEEQLVKQGLDWWSLKDGAGKIHLSAVWKPVVMTGFAEGLGHGSYRSPIGVVRIKFFGAKDLKNVEAMTGGKSDPYVRILSGMQVRGQTEYIDDNLDPTWDTALYVPVHSIREDLILEVMDYNEFQKDKTLGQADLILKDIIRETTTPDGQKVYEGVHKSPQDRHADLLNHERKKGKGTLHYEVSFHPTLELAKKEDEKKDETQAAEAPAEQTNGTTPAQPDTETSTAPVKEELPEKDLHGELIKYTEDKRIDLLAYNSGILSVTIHAAQLPEKEKVTADILLDSNDAQYRTAQVKGRDLPFNETGDAFVKELDFSRLVVRLKPVKDNDKEDSYVGFWTNPVRDIVKKLQTRSAEEQELIELKGEEFKLLECPGGTIRLSFAYRPVIQFALDPSESLENQGNLTVTPLKASNLRAADRSGTSDPFVVFRLDDIKVHKTEVYKKQLNPVFKDEVFTVPVLRRIGARLTAQVYDWDQIGKDTLLGEAQIPFMAEQLESFAAKEVEVDLGEGATLKVRLLWQPQLLARRRTGTSLLSATTRMFTSAPGAALGGAKSFAGAGLDAGLGAGGKVFGAGGKVLGGGVSVIGGSVSALGSGIRGIGRLGKKEKPSAADSPVTPSPTNSSIIAAEAHPTTNGQPLVEAASPVAPAPTHISRSTSSNLQMDRKSMDSTISGTAARSIVNTDSSDGSAGRDGTIHVTLSSARNLKAMDRSGTSDPYVRVRIGNKVVYKTKHIKKTLTPEWNESFSYRIGSGKSVMDIKVKDHNTLKDDVDIGEITFDVWERLQNGQTAFDGWVPLTPEGTGELHVRVELSDSLENGSSGRGLFGKRI